MATCVVPVGREVNAWIAIEEPAGHQLEPGEDAGLDGKVFWPDLMMEAEYVPEDNVGILDVAILLDEIRYTSGAVRMVHVLTGRIALFRIIGRDPQLVLDEVRPPPRRRLRMNERRDRMARLELVCRRRPDPVPAVGVDNLPGTMRRRVDLTAAAELGLQNRLFLVEAIAICILRPPRIRVGI